MTVTVVILTLGDLGLVEGVTTKEIIGSDHDTDEEGNAAPFTRGRCAVFGLELCPPQVAPQYRLNYKSQPLHERLYVAMKPIADPDGEPRIFVLWHNTDGLSLDAVWARPYDRWHRNDKFMFCTKP